MLEEDNVQNKVAESSKILKEAGFTQAQIEERAAQMGLNNAVTQNLVSSYKPLPTGRGSSNLDVKQPLKLDRWVDGDTAVLSDSSRIRLQSVDTAEMDTPEGKAAHQYTKTIAPTTGDYQVEKEGFGLYGREIGQVTRVINDTPIDLHLVQMEANYTKYHTAYGANPDSTLDDRYNAYFSRYAPMQWGESFEPLPKDEIQLMHQNKIRLAQAVEGFQEGDVSQEEVDQALYEVFKDPNKVVRYRKTLDNFEQDVEDDDSSVKGLFRRAARDPEYREAYNKAMAGTPAKFVVKKQLHHNFYKKWDMAYKEYDAITHIGNVLELQKARDIGHNPEISDNELISGAPDRYHEQIIAEARLNGTHSASVLRDHIVENHERGLFLDDLPWWEQFAFSTGTALLQPQTYVTLPLGMAAGSATATVALFAKFAPLRSSAAIMGIWGATAGIEETIYGLPRLAGDPTYDSRHLALDGVMGIGAGTTISGLVIGGKYVGEKAFKNQIKKAQHKKMLQEARKKNVAELDNRRAREISDLVKENTDGDDSSGGTFTRTSTTTDADTATQVAEIIAEDVTATAIVRTIDSEPELTEDILIAQIDAGEREFVQSVTEEGDVYTAHWKKRPKALEGVASKTPAKKPTDVVSLDTINKVSKDLMQPIVYTMRNIFPNGTPAQHLLSTIEIVNRAAHADQMEAVEKLNATVVRVLSKFPDGKVPASVATDLQRLAYNQTSHSAKHVLANILEDKSANPTKDLKALIKSIKDQEHLWEGYDPIPLSREGFYKAHSDMISRDQQFLEDSTVNTLTESIPVELSQLRDIMALNEKARILDAKNESQQAGTYLDVERGIYKKDKDGKRLGDTYQPVDKPVFIHRTPEPLKATPVQLLKIPPPPKRKKARLTKKGGQGAKNAKQKQYDKEYEAAQLRYDNTVKSIELANVKRREKHTEDLPKSEFTKLVEELNGLMDTRIQQYTTQSDVPRGSKGYDDTPTKQIPKHTDTQKKHREQQQILPDEARAKLFKEAETVEGLVKLVKKYKKTEAGNKRAAQLKAKGWKQVNIVRQLKKEGLVELTETKELTKAGKTRLKAIMKKGTKVSEQVQQEVPRIQRTETSLHEGTKHSSEGVQEKAGEGSLEEKDLEHIQEYDDTEVELYGDATGFIKDPDETMFKDPNVEIKEDDVSSGLIPKSMTVTTTTNIRDTQKLTGEVPTKDIEHLNDRLMSDIEKDLLDKYETKVDTYAENVGMDKIRKVWKKDPKRTQEVHQRMINSRSMDTVVAVVRVSETIANEAKQVSSKPVVKSKLHSDDLSTEQVEMLNSLTKQEHDQLFNDAGSLDIEQLQTLIQKAEHAERLHGPFKEHVEPVVKEHIEAVQKVTKRLPKPEDPVVTPGGKPNTLVDLTVPEGKLAKQADQLYEDISVLELHLEYRDDLATTAAQYGWDADVYTQTVIDSLDRARATLKTIETHLRRDPTIPTVHPEAKHKLGTAIQTQRKINTPKDKIDVLDENNRWVNRAAPPETPETVWEEVLRRRATEARMNFIGPHLEPVIPKIADTTASPVEVPVTSPPPTSNPLERPVTEQEIESLHHEPASLTPEQRVDIGVRESAAMTKMKENSVGAIISATTKWLSSGESAELANALDHDGMSEYIGNLAGSITQDLTTVLQNAPLETLRMFGALVPESAAGFGGKVQRKASGAIIKDAKYRESLTQIMPDYVQLMDDFCKEKGYNFVRRAFAQQQAGMDNEAVDMFNKQVFKIQELRKQGLELTPDISPSVIEFVKRWDNYTGYSHKILVEADAGGFTAKRKVKHYIPHVWKLNNLHGAVSKHGEDLVEKVLAKGYRESSNRSTPLSVKDSIAMAKEQIAWIRKQESEPDDQYAPPSDSRARERKEINTLAEIDGLSVLDLLDTEVAGIATKYSHRVGGWIGLAESTNGLIKNDVDIQSWRAIIQAEGQSQGLPTKELDNYLQWYDDTIEMMMGRPTRDGLDERLRDFKDASALTRMGGLGMAQLIETGQVITRATINLFSDFDTVKAIFNTAGIDLLSVNDSKNPLMKEIQSISSLSNDVEWLDRQSVHLDQHEIDKSKPMRAFSLLLADKATFGSLKAPASRLLGKTTGYNMIRRAQSRIVQTSFMHDVANHFLSGTGKMGNKRLADLGVTDVDGINDAMKDQFIKYAEMDENGVLTKLNIEKWDKPVRDQLQYAMIRDEAQMIQRTLIGEAPPWHNKPMLALIAQFREMMIVSQNKQLARSMKFADKEAVTATLLNTAMAGLVRYAKFAGLAAGTAAITGQEIETPTGEQMQLHKYILQLGIFGDAYDLVLGGHNIVEEGVYDHTTVDRALSEVPVYGLAKDYVNVGLGWDDGRLQATKGIVPLGNTAYGDHFFTGINEIIENLKHRQE